MLRLILLCIVGLVAASPVLLQDGKDEIICDVCQVLLKDVREKVSSEKSQAKMVDLMMNKCQLLEGVAKERCFDVVQGLTPGMLELVAHEMNPSELCSFLKFCPEVKPEIMLEKKPEPIVERKAEPMVEKEPVDKTTVCEFCQFLINIVERVVKKNSSLPAINQTVFEICDKLPSFLQSLCFEEAPKIVKAMVDGIDPHDVCVKIGACTGTDGKKRVEWKVITCDICNAVAEQIIPEEAGAVCMELKTCQQTKPKVRTEVKQDGVALCELCKFVVETLDKYIKQNKSEQVINQTVYNFCNSLPGELKDMCLSFAPKLVAALANGVDPKTACTDITLCVDVTPIEEAPSETVEETEPQSAALCELCEFVVQTIDQYIKQNKSEEAINQTVYNFCNSLPEPLKNMCLQFAPQLVQALSQGVDPKKACETIKLCTDTVSEVYRYRRSLEVKTSGPACELCEFLINAIDKYIQKNKTEAFINQTVYNFCTKLPDPLKNTVSPLCELCQFVVNALDIFVRENKTEQVINATIIMLCNKLPEPFKANCLGFAPDLVKVLVEGLDPQKACATIGICSDIEKQNSTPVEPIPQPKTEIKDKDNDLKCDLCKTVVQLVDSYLKNNKSEAAINATVYKICNSLPGEFKEMCLAMAPTLIKALANGFDPEKACAAINMCTNSTGVNIAVKTNPIEEIEHAIEKKIGEFKKDNDLKCDLCKTVVQMVDSYVKNNKSAAFINATVYKICESLPAGFKEMCVSMAPSLVKELENGLDPDKACTKIHMCTNNTDVYVKETNPVEEIEHAAKVAFKKVEKDNDFKCDLCKTVVQFVDSYLKNNKSAEAINATVYKICNSLPAGLKDMCLQMAPELIKELMNGLDPDKACTAIHMCTNSTVSLMSILRSMEAMPMDSLKCEMCKSLMSAIDEDLYGDEDKMKKTLDTICHRLPPPTDKKCLGFIDPNFAEMWEKFLSKMISPDKVCEFLKVCPPNRSV